VSFENQPFVRRARIVLTTRRPVKEYFFTRQKFFARRASSLKARARLETRAALRLCCAQVRFSDSLKVDADG
jgi:hypothetical protein